MASLLLAIACGDDGCSGCGSGCAVGPIPGGYPLEHRIDNAAQARLTDSGIAFLEQNVSALLAQLLPDGLEFPVTSPDICAGGGCRIRGEVRGFDIEPVAPNRLRVRIELAVTSRNSFGDRGAIRDACMTLIVPICCDIDVDTSRGARDSASLLAAVDFVVELEAAREGYTRIVVGPAEGDSYFAPNGDLEADDFAVSGGGVCGIVDLFRTFVASEINSQFGQKIQDALDEQLCTRRGANGCPGGTFAFPDEDPGSMCRYEARKGARCVPTLIGADGRGDLGEAALSTLSPGVQAPGQFLLAAAGDGEAVNGGLSLFFYGGFMGMDPSFTTTPAHSSCVPLVEPPPLPVIPRVESFRANVVPGTLTPTHVGLGVSEKFLNYAGYGAFDSGLLCLGIGPQTSQQLTTGLVSLFLPSIEQLTFPRSDAPVAIALRPNHPPAIEVGEGGASDPLLQVTLPDLGLDLYAWSLERYVRVLTYRATVAIPIDLSVEGQKLSIVLGTVTSDDGVVTNSDLLTESPTDLATAMDSIVPTLVGVALGTVKPVNLPQVAGFQLEVPGGGLRGVSDSGEEFLGLFASLAPIPLPVEPVRATPRANVHVERLDGRPLAVRSPGAAAARRPYLWVSFDSEGGSWTGRSVEFSYRIDGQPWSAWSVQMRRTIQDSALLLQARHVLEVRGRYASEPESADRTPARTEILVDVLAPRVRAERVEHGVRIEAADLITPVGKLEARVRLDGQPWGPWGALAFVPAPADDTLVEIEVRDEVGNIGAARAALIRGRADPAARACSCSIVGADGADSRSAWRWIVGLVFLVWVALRCGRRRGVRDLGDAAVTGGKPPLEVPGKPSFPGGRPHERLNAAILLIFALAGAGCDCSGGAPTTRCGGTCSPAVGGLWSGSLCCESTQACVAYDMDALCPDSAMVCASAADVTLDPVCGATCGRCVRKPALDPGLLASDLDFVVREDGEVLVSGYSPGAPPDSPYGDLVVGVYNPTTEETVWEIVDGAPASPITHDPAAWRAGVSAAGEDVGRYTSMVSDGDVLSVAYYDATHGALKLASGVPGSWVVHTVDDTADSGRYASLALDATGRPMIAYLRMGERSTVDGERLEGSVEFAAANVASPEEASDWTLTKIASAPIPCRTGGCASGEVCLADGRCVTTTTDCSRDCGTKVCVAGSCKALVSPTLVEDLPTAYGLFVSLARTAAGAAVVYYDRVGGNVWGVRQSAGAWGTPFLIDGYARNEAGVGDSGIAADLFVDASDVWHVLYVDAGAEALRHAEIVGDSIMRETVDRGLAVGATPNADGRHIVGDDASVVVTRAGEVRAVYQDATAARAMRATRASGSTIWVVSVLDDQDATGFALSQILLPSDESLAITFWRRQQSPLASGIRVIGDAT